MNTQQTDKWLYFRCSTSHQDFISQQTIIKNYFASKEEIKNIDRFPLIEDFAKKRDKKMRQKNIIIQLYKVPDNSTLYCSELSRIGSNAIEIYSFIEACYKRKIKIIQCKDGTEIENKSIGGKALIAALSLVSDIELDGIRTRSRAGMQAYISKGGKCGRSHPNYAQSIDPEQHKENCVRGNILRAKNRNENFVRSEKVERFCKILMYIRKEFEKNLSTDKGRFFYSDYHKIKVRLTGDDYVTIVDRWNNWEHANPEDVVFEKLNIPKAQNKFHTIMKALRLYEKNNELISL